jgi:hypothetical protein
MFGYQAGASPQAMAKMKAERSRAVERWPFLTSLDLSTISGERQLASIVKDRTGSSLADAQSDVHQWMIGYSERVSGATAGRAALSRWDNEGGSPAPDAAKDVPS